jgi:hypothetical protein
MLSRRRRAIVWGLIVLASLIGLVSILTTWADRQALDAGSWRDASADLIEDQEVRDALSVYLVDQLYANVDVGAALSERLPANLKPAAAPIAGALRQPATDAVDRLLEAPRVQQLFITASSLAQEKLVNVLEDTTGAGITTGDGTVTLDLRELLLSLATSLGLPGTRLEQLPPGAGQVTVMRSDQLAAAQSAVRGIRVLSAWLLVLVLAMFALAVFLARGARRETLRNIGFAWVIVGLLVLVARRGAGNYVIDALTQPASRESGKRAWLIGTQIMGQIGWAVIVYGVAMIAAALLAGPHAWARWVRHRIAPVLNDRPGIAWATVAGLFLVLVAWGPTHAFRTLWGVALLAALTAAGVLALRRQTLAERDPDAAAPPPLAPGAGDVPA